MDTATLSEQSMVNVKLVTLAAYILRGVKFPNERAYKDERKGVLSYITRSESGLFTVEGYEHPVTGEVLDRVYEVLTPAEARAAGAHGTWGHVAAPRLFDGPMEFCIVEVA